MNILVCVVDIRRHGGHHVYEIGYLGKVVDDIASFDANVVVFVNEQKLDDDENFVYVQPDDIIEFVEHRIDNFDRRCRRWSSCVHSMSRGRILSKRDLHGSHDSRALAAIRWQQP